MVQLPAEVSAQHRIIISYSLGNLEVYDLQTNKLKEHSGRGKKERSKGKERRMGVHPILTCLPFPSSFFLSLEGMEWIWKCSQSCGSLAMLSF